MQVKDTGVGIAPEDQPNIFHPFFQAGKIRDAVGGIGLGLAISRNSVRLMGGELTFHSQPGVGTTFCFEIVLTRLPVTAPPLDGAQSGAPTPHLQTMRLPSTQANVWRTALVEADYDRMLELADSLAVSHPPEGRHLRELVECFDYPALLEWLDGQDDSPRNEEEPQA